ncbi:LysM peptidoglycan-binding domain-containing protein [Mesorhizobium intechi]|uniref:LysM peptidoglycan-binding domain-containing protein n=1 Tax=Mesorhizobium intechi TaxID=537601 RepID=A0A8T9AKA1_9HYPH|nr:LysM peptidoglycan-binding domain-containing protein [Mesorhizobium intechi]TSE02890.1 LysM peptidoglycan-binding domain-containing protein [Mesorhizobium intechi]
MVRPITLTKPPLQTQKVNANADAAQVARLEAQAAALRDQIRLANRMGERDWAAQARQELAHVNTQLTSLQPKPATAPAVPSVNVASNGTSGNGTTVTPTLYLNTNLAGPAVKLVDLDGTPANDDAAAASTARDIVKDVTGGKSIDQIASDRHMTREQVTTALRSGGMTVSDSSAPSGDTQTTKITDADGRTVTQFYDYQHDSYYATVQDKPGGATITSPIRDGLGRKETTSYNSDTGAVTTRYEDDLGTGTVTERTSLPNGASVETVTPGAGPSLPVTTVTGPDGRKTILAPAQDPNGADTSDIRKGLADGKSIDQIAKENGLTDQQVIAELEAAGYQVKATDSSDAQSVEIVDPRSGDKIVYSHDYQHDVRTVTTTADGKQTSQSIDGNGTETKTVTDKDGRVTKITTEKINGGKPVEHQVKPGDNLSLIAKQYGVTLDDLRRTNPQLFDSSRDPNVIHDGEKVTIDNGTRTTVEVTFNGYTLTTKPGGGMTLHNNTTGTDLKIEARSTQEALARTLLAVNPNSSNPKEAKEGEVVKTFVEGLLAGEALPGLIAAAEKAGQDKQALIDKYHLGPAAKPKLDGQNKVVDPFGDPPQGNAPSGGKWMPMKIDGVWTWVDPQVAQAITTENIALSRVTETRALAGQRQEQLNVDMLDPAYKDALDGAQTIINKALAPNDLQWTPQKPKGTLADAQTRLTKANTLLQNAQDARGEYENAGRVLNDAIAGQGPLTQLGDPNAPSASARGTPDLHPQRDQSVADHSAVDKLFSEAGLHLSKGDKLTIDFLVGQADLNGVSKDSNEYKNLKNLQTTAGSQLELARAYQNYFDAHADATQINARQTDLEQKLSNEYLGEQKFNFDEKYNRINGDYLGHYKNSTLEIRDGQLWVVNHFDEGTTEQQLTYALNDKNVRDEYRDRQLNKDWQTLLAGYDANAKACTANGLQSVKAGEELAAKNLNDVLDKQLGDSIADLKTQLPALQTNFDNVLKNHKPGTVDAPAGTLPDGAQPVEIDVGGQKIKVAPDVAQNYDKTGIDALTKGGKAIWIDLDTEDDDASGRWVDPEVAVAKLELGAVRLQISQAEDLRKQLQSFNDYHELRLSEPSLLADDNTTVDKAYLDEHEQRTLDAIYQPKYQQLFAKGKGHDNEFHEQGDKALDGTVASTLGLDGSTDDGRDAIENVTDEIRDIGGDNPYVRSVPIFYVDDQVGTQQVTLFAVRDGDGNTRYVDATGKKFDDLGDFQDNNSQFSENGKLVVPKNLEMKAGADGTIALEVVKARNVSVWDKVVDPLVGIGTGIATILSFTPAAPVAAPLAYTGAAYLGTRAVINEVNHLDHGGEWYDAESLTNIASAATTVLPMASSGLRTIGMAAKSETFLAGLSASPRAFAGSIGATRSDWALASETRTYMQSSARLNKAAWGLDVGSVIVGAPLLATSAYDLAANGDQMNGLQLANALTGLGTGVTGTGLGIHGLRTLRPGTGEQAAPNAPGANPPPGNGGPFQQPPGGKGPRQSPPALGSGPSGRPMNVYAIGPDGVYRPTGEQVFHDPSHPVIPGEVIKADDAGSYDTTASTGRDPDGPTVQGTPHPADGDAIIVQGGPTAKDGSLRLVWDPEALSFTGLPERETSGDVSTSGKDGAHSPPRPAPKRQGSEADGSSDPSSAKPLTQDEIAANRQEAANLVDDMLPHSLGMPEVTKANLIDQISRSPTLMELLRNAHAKDVRIVNPARHDLRIFDANSGDDLTATGSQYVGDVDVVFVDAETFRADDADGDTVLAEFVDMLGHELSHVGDAPIDPHPADFSDRQTYRDAVVSGYLKVEGEAGFVQYAVADELAANGGKPAAILQWDAAQADVFTRYKAGEIDRNQAVDEMAALFGDKEPSTADGTYVDFYSRYADGVYDDHTSSGTGLAGETGRPAPANRASNNGPLTRDGVRATPLDQVPDLVMADFQPNQIPWLKREQAAELTERQFHDMDQAGLLPYLTRSQLRGIPKSKIGFVNVAGLGEKQIPWLTEGHIRNLTDQQLHDLGKAGLTRHLTKPQVQAVKGDKVGLIDMSTLEGGQVPWFKPGQVSKFTSQQFKDLGEAGLLNTVTERQVRAIQETMIGSLDMAKFDPRQVPWLTERQIPHLTRDQWGAFTIHHTEALTQPHIEAATSKQFRETSPGQFRKFTPEQFEWMSGDQKNALSVLHLTTFRATHKKTMTPDQAASVDLALSHARKRENAQALATFGGMSTTSYVLWSSLPPTWTATAGAVAFGVRGLVFGAQAIFPNATASNKPFGRFLNALGGATFIAAAPGAATGMVQGKDIVVNSTFSLGNVVYGTKSMLQSFTGRPVIRNLAEYLAGPGYVLGCAVYTLHSWPAPIATVAGGMFTFGCAEFWASAIRTDRMNRRSVPRTDADIAAAAKSDKRWATADRWTLGITFGIGMLLFSLDSLLAQPWDTKPAAPPDPNKPDGDGSSQQPDDHPDVPDGPKTPPEHFPQLVVSADDGLNLRSQPEGDAAVVTVLRPGTFVEQTAKPSTDPSGEAWIPVEGFGPDGKMHSGWASGDYVEVHPAGSSNPQGRTNPTLEKDGYQWVEVRNGDSMRLIARAHSADVADTVVLNMDHILSPDMIFSGDRIYLPIASVG